MEKKRLKYFLGAAIIFISVFIFKLNILRAYNGVELVSVTYEKESVLELNVGNLPAINNQVIYIANRNSRLANGRKLPDRGLTVVSPYNVYIKGNYNSIPGQWQPAAVITNSLLYILSDDFEDRQEMPALRVPRNYGSELNYIKTDNNLGVTLSDLLTSGTPGEKALLEAEIKSFFGISSFSVSGIDTEKKLEQAIRGDGGYWGYSDEYNNNPGTTGTKRTPNKANTNQDGGPAVKLAIASPYDISAPWDYGYMLEDWSGRSLSIEGAFIQLKESWAAEKDVPPLAYYKRTGGPNAAGEDPMWNSSGGVGIFINPTSPAFEYEEQFASPGSRPSADFLAGSQSRWEELDATSDNFTHHKL